MKTAFFHSTVSASRNYDATLRRVLGAALLFCLTFFPQAKSHAQDVDAATDVAQQNLKLIVDDWKDLQRSFKESDSLDNLIQDFDRRLTSNGETITRLPDENPKKAEMLATLNKIKAEFPVQAKAAQGALELKHIKEYWERDSGEGEGWEKESPATFSAMLKQQSEAMSKLGMPKTVAMHNEATKFVESTKPQTDDAALKAFLGNIAKTRDATRAKLVKAATAIIDEASKTTLKQDGRDRLENFGQDDLRLALGSAPETAGLQARATTLVAAFDKAAGGTKAEVDKLSGDLNEKAASGWPALAGKVKISSDFNAAAALKNPGKFAGQYFLFSGVSNRMGWDFKTGSYDFALHSNGTAVVGRYDAAVKSIVEDTKKRLNLDDLPEESYDIIAEVTDTAKATVFQDVEGDVKVNGSSDTLKVSGRREVSEDAVLLHIIGLHVGPVAVVAGAGAVQADGTVKEVAGPSGSSGGSGFFTRLLWCLIGLAAGLLVLIKANYAPLAKVSQLQKVQTLSPSLVANIGLVILALGVWFLVWGMVIYGLLVSASFLLAGLYLSLNFFVARKWLPETIAAKIRPQGINIGLAVCGIALLHLVLGGRFMVI